MSKELDSIIAYHNSEEGKVMQEIFEQNGNKGQENQANGIAFERKQHNKEKRNSILSVLSSGSLGLVDIVSIRKTYVLLISCKKNGYVEPKERKAYDKLKSELPTFCRLQLRYKKGKKTIKTMW